VDEGLPAPRERCQPAPDHKALSVWLGTVPSMYEYDIDVRYRDVDPLRHVSHVEFVTYMQQARLAYLEEELNMNERGIDPVVVHVEVDYEDAIELEDDVTVHLECTDPGDTSFRTDYEFRVDDHIVATGHSIQVAAYAETGETRELSAEWRDAME